MLADDIELAQNIHLGKLIPKQKAIEISQKLNYDAVIQQRKVDNQLEKQKEIEERRMQKYFKPQVTESLQSFLKLKEKGNIITRPKAARELNTIAENQNMT